MLIQKLSTAFSRLILNLTFKSVLIISLLYFSISYCLLTLTGEVEITAPNNFFYWIVVTASTVGYGDLSPSTLSGKIVTALFVIPFGLSVFALSITQTSLTINSIIQRKVKGLHMSRAQSHYLIIGFHSERTLKLIELLHNDSQIKSDKKSIVLCVTKNIENPAPHLVDMIKVTSFSDDTSMQRTNIDKAKCIIIDSQLDDETLRAALYCQSVNPNCHTTAYFQDDSVAKLLKDLHPHIEIVPSVSIEMLVKASLDPGSSQLHKQLLDNTVGMTQYSDIYEGEDIDVKTIFIDIKKTFNATLIGIQKQNNQEVFLNPSHDQIITSGDNLFYICQSRIDL